MKLFMMFVGSYQKNIFLLKKQNQADKLQPRSLLIQFSLIY